MELHLRIVGILLILLSLIHVCFPAHFKWKSDLQGISLINRQMMYMHTFFIALAVLLIGCLCMVNERELVKTQLGRTIAAGLGIFWGIRLVVQFFGYSSALWRGKRLETTIHIVFVLLWSYMTFVFSWVGLGRD